jgi:hypothetical protein
LAHVRILEHFPEISGKKIEAILFLDIGNPFETLTFIVIFGVSVRYFRHLIAAHRFLCHVVTSLVF